MRSVLTAGVDTTVSALGAAIYCLARFSEQFQRLRADPGLARAAFEEAVRFESPVQTFFRTTMREVEIGGVRIDAGEKILMFLGAANRDPRRWSRPDDYDITRQNAGHVGFGTGIHGCVGQVLARLEGEVVLAALARKAVSIEIDRAGAAAAKQHAARAVEPADDDYAIAVSGAHRVGDRAARREANPPLPSEKGSGKPPLALCHHGNRPSAFGYVAGWLGERFTARHRAAGVVARFIVKQVAMHRQ